MARKYDPEQIETKWQKVWQERETFVARNPVDESRSDEALSAGPVSHGSRSLGKGRDATYVLEMFPYPSGSAHMGHVKNYAMGDVIARFRRHQGQRVLHPMGYDAFGLNSENMAIKTGEPPGSFTEAAIATINQQLRRLGVSIDWTREVVTCRPDYYKWTQWLFLQLYKKGLAYKKEAPVNWCPSCQTVLANEQVIEGTCERCDSLVEAKKLSQWFFRITDYAERLLEDFDKLESWPERVLTMQRNWIGKSVGADVIFAIAPAEGGPVRGTPAEGEAAGDAAGTTEVTVFTTRPDTLFGATFFILAPEHPLVDELVRGLPQEEEVRRYVAKAMATSAIERASIEKEKTGVFTGRYAVNPVTGGLIPVYVADYVLMEYGTGAIMAVPGHDERDFAFAKKYGLEVVEVIESPEEFKGEQGEMVQAYPGDGLLVNSGAFDGLAKAEGIVRITEWLKEQGKADFAVNYKLRDWLVSRQRYWGAPIPIVYCETCGEVPVPDEGLPVLLPGHHRLCAQGQVASGRGGAVGEHHLPHLRRAGSTRERHDGHVRRLVLVLPALRLALAGRRGLRPGGGGLLAAGGPVHRGRGARHPPPDVLPLLHQGALRPGPGGFRGTVQELVHPGDDLPQGRQDVQEQGQRGQSRRARGSSMGPTRCAATSCSWARGRATSSGTTRASRVSTVSWAGCGARSRTQSTRDCWARAEQAARPARTSTRRRSRPLSGPCS